MELNLALLAQSTELVLTPLDVQKRTARQQVLDSRLKWLKDSLIPSTEYTQVLSALAYTRPIKRLLHAPTQWSLFDLSLCLAYWQLLCYTQNQYLTDPHYDQLNQLIKAHWGTAGFYQRRLITPALLQRFEGYILHDFFNYYTQQSTQYFTHFLPDQLHYYTQLLAIWEQYLPTTFTPALKKRIHVPSRPYPATLFVWVVRKELLKKIIPTLLYKLDIEESVIQALLPLFHQQIEQYYSAIFYQKSSGILSRLAWAFVLLNQHLLPHSDQLMTRVRTLIPKYSTQRSLRHYVQHLKTVLQAIDEVPIKPKAKEVEA